MKLAIVHNKDATIRYTGQESCGQKSFIKPELHVPSLTLAEISPFLPTAVKKLRFLPLFDGTLTQGVKPIGTYPYI